MSGVHQNQGFQMDERDYVSAQIPDEHILPGQPEERYYNDRWQVDRTHSRSTRDNQVNPYVNSRHGSNFDYNRPTYYYRDRGSGPDPYIPNRSKVISQKYDAETNAPYNRSGYEEHDGRQHYVVNSRPRYTDAIHDEIPHQLQGGSRDIRNRLPPHMRPSNRQIDPRNERISDRVDGTRYTRDQNDEVFQTSNYHPSDSHPDERDWHERPYYPNYYRDRHTYFSDNDVHMARQRNRNHPSTHSFRNEQLEMRNENHGVNQCRPQSSAWNEVLEMLPSQMDRAAGTLRFRGTLRSHHNFQNDDSPQNIIDDTDIADEKEMKPKTKADVYENLMKLREQPWSMRVRKKRKQELTHQLGSVSDNWYKIGPVVSVVESGTKTFNNVISNIDPFHGMLKRIEGKHGASVVAVFNFIRDMIRLNLAITVLILCGVTIPSAILVDETDQSYTWYLQKDGNSSDDQCSYLELVKNSSWAECNVNYTSKIENIVEDHSGKFIALFRDFLQGTGFLELTFLFSGFYPPLIENGSSSLLVGLAYILSGIITIFLSLIFVVRFLAIFLKKSTSLTGDYGMAFSKIVFTGWDFTVKEQKAAKIESSLFVCEVKAAFDDENHIKRSLERSRNDTIKLYAKRIVINLIILSLIGGSWTGIVFLIKESEQHTSDSPAIQFFWEYAPTMTVAALNMVFPMIFSYLVTHEQYKGSVELFLTLGRSVLVRLTSLAILIITKIDLINKNSSKVRACDIDTEFVCWETYLGQQIYSILILDALIQIVMTLVVNLLRSSLKRFKKPICQKLGTIEFYVPGHVLDVVYIQALCWIGLLYSPLIVFCCFVYFCLLFFLKLFTVSVTCVPASRVFRASRSSAMFMTILALAFFMCLIPNGLSLFFLYPSIACSPFRGLEYAWEVITYYICNLSGSAYWIRSVLFFIDGYIVCMVLLVLVFLAGVYYISVFSARGALIEHLETKMKNANKDRNYVLKEYERAKRECAVD